MAGGGGVEPPQSEPESDVLPLDDPPTYDELKSGVSCSQDLKQTMYDTYTEVLHLLSISPLTRPSSLMGEGKSTLKQS